MRALRLFVLSGIAVTLAAAAAFAQGVGINATGAAADTSALLDLSSTTKGLLVPRMTAMDRAALVLPATGLLLYQTDSVPGSAAGFLFNYGTPVAPIWMPITTPMSSQWQTSGIGIYYNTGRVGIGRSAPASPLDILGGNWDVVGGEGDFRIGDASTRLKIGIATGGGGTGAATIMEQGAAGAYNVLALGTQGNKVLFVNGNSQRVGIGVDAPTAPLGFGTGFGKKISLYPGALGDAGFGIAGNRLQVFGDNPNADVALGYDSLGTFNERFAVKPTGALAVFGSTGTSGQVLTSGGSGQARWTTPGAGPWSTNGSSVYYAGGNVGIGNASPNAPLSFPPTLTHKITLYPGASGDVGFGVAGNRLQIYSDNPNADVALGYDAAGTFNERFSFRPTGAMAVNGNAGAVGQVLQSNGSGAAATWVSPTNAAFNNTYQTASTGLTALTTAAGLVSVPGLSQTFTVGSNAKVVASQTLKLYAPSCFACGTALLYAYLTLDGTDVDRVNLDVNNGQTFTYGATTVLTVGPGTHTLAVRIANITGPDVTFNGTGIAASYLTLQVMQQ
jgi:hypothetical protein